MLNEHLPTGALLAVYPDRSRADEVVGRLIDLGIDRAAIRVDAPRDEVTSLDAEVREEVNQGVSSPTVGVAYPKEAAKAGMALGPPLVAIGAVVGALASLPVGDGTWPIWLRVLVGVIVGAVMGGAIAAVIIPAMAVKNPHDPSPAEAGVTLRVADGSAEVIDVLVAAHPQRLDRLDRHGAAIDTIVTEEAFRSGGIVEEVADNFRREHDAPPEHKTR